MFDEDSSLITMSVILNSRLRHLRAVSSRNSLGFAIPDNNELPNAASEHTFGVDSSLITISVIPNSRLRDLRAASGRNSLEFAIPDYDESPNAASEQFCRLNDSSCSKNVPGKKSRASKTGKSL